MLSPFVTDFFFLYTTLLYLQYKIYTTYNMRPCTLRTCMYNTLRPALINIPLIHICPMSNFFFSLVFNNETIEY